MIDPILELIKERNAAEKERDEARAEVARLRERSKQWKLAAKDWRRFTFYMWRRYRAELAAKEAAK